MKCLIILLLLAIKVNAQEGEWRRLLSAEQDIYVEPLPTSSSSIDYTSLSIDPKLFTGVRHYLVQANTNNMPPGHIPAFQIGFQEGVLKIFKTAVPNHEREGYGLSNLYVSNHEAIDGYSDLETLALDPADWIRTSGNYRIPGDSLELECRGISMHNTFFIGISPLVFKAKVLDFSSVWNPISSLMIQPFNPEERTINLSDSIFQSEGGAFVRGMIDFDDILGIKGDKPDIPLFLLAGETFSLTIKGSKSDLA